MLFDLVGRLNLVVSSLNVYKLKMVFLTGSLYRLVSSLVTFLQSIWLTESAVEWFELESNRLKSSRLSFSSASNSRSSKLISCLVGFLRHSKFKVSVGHAGNADERSILIIGIVNKPFGFVMWKGCKVLGC